MHNSNADCHRQLSASFTAVFLTKRSHILRIDSFNMFIVASILQMPSSSSSILIIPCSGANNMHGSACMKSMSVIPPCRRLGYSILKSWRCPRFRLRAARRVLLGELFCGTQQHVHILIIRHQLNILNTLLFIHSCKIML